MSNEVITKYYHLFQSLVDEGWNDESIEALKSWREIYDQERSEIKS